MAGLSRIGWWIGVASIFSLAFISGVHSATFTLVNRCSYNLWPAIQTTSAGKEVLSGGGFSLGPSATSPIPNVPDSWSGRLWARTGCNFDNNGQGSCATGDCGNGIACNGNSYQPPVTLAEFTLGGFNGRTFYDVSAVDGFNVPLSISPSQGAASDPSNYDCGSPSCTADVNGQCPAELQETNGGQVVACKSACIAFQQPQYCCTGDYNDRNKCVATNYSQFFKNLCPTAYSYAFDDPTSTFSCTGGDYTITFCA